MTVTVKLFGDLIELSDERHEWIMHLSMCPRVRRCGHSYHYAGCAECEHYVRMWKKNDELHDRMRVAEGLPV